MVGKTVEYEGNRYLILDELLSKCETTGVWYEAYVYQAVASGLKYCRNKRVIDGKYVIVD